MNKLPFIFSFFSGAGFLDLGFELSGYPTALVNETFLPFIEAHRYSRKNFCLLTARYNYDNFSVEDYLEVQGKDRLKSLLRDARASNSIVSFIGGPPCPDFSVGGKNRGQNGDQGRLSATFVEVICQQKPDFFLFENVKGLWRTKKHRQFYEEIKTKLSEAEYILTEHLINAIEYGVPQNRERIIVIGFLSDLLPNNLLRKKTDNLIFPWDEYKKYDKAIISNLSWPTVNDFKEDSSFSCPESIIQDLTVEYWFRKNDAANHQNSKHHFMPRAAKKKFALIQEGDYSKKPFKRLHRWRYPPTAC